VGHKVGTTSMKRSTPSAAEGMPLAPQCHLTMTSRLYSEFEDSNPLKNKNQLDTTYYFTVLLIGSTCFGHY